MGERERQCHGNAGVGLACTAPLRGWFKGERIMSGGTGELGFKWMRSHQGLEGLLARAPTGQAREPDGAG